MKLLDSDVQFGLSKSIMTLQYMTLLWRYRYCDLYYMNNIVWVIKIRKNAFKKFLSEPDIEDSKFLGFRLKLQAYFQFVQCGSLVWNSPMLSFFHVKIWTKRLCSSFLQPKNYRKMISYHAKVTGPLFDEWLKIKLRDFP